MFLPNLANSYSGSLNTAVDPLINMICPTDLPDGWEERQTNSGAAGPPAAAAAPLRPPLNPPRQPSRSPSNRMTEELFYLDNVSFDQIKYNVKSGNNSHTHEKCNVYKGFLKNRCYLCKLFHSTFLCKNALQQKSKSVFENKAAKN